MQTGYCEFLCSLLEEAVGKDVLSVPSDSISSGFHTQSTVGMMLVGKTIDNMVRARMCNVSFVRGFSSKCLQHDA